MKKNPHEVRWNRRAMERALSLTQMSSPETDPQGSYTGNPPDGERPIQDADDL